MLTLFGAGLLQDRVVTEEVAQAISNLHRWFQTMRQRGGYGGPVAHWWQSRYQYTGPGLDWRYEGILQGYALLSERTGDESWNQAAQTAADDLITGQQPDGAYRASQFEINPGVLGTPHEAGATLGLLTALPHLPRPGEALGTAGRNLDNIILRLWDRESGGFNDLPGVRSRVPNKLATLALALMALAEVSGQSDYLAYARSALDDVLRYQAKGGVTDGGVHQYDPGHGSGDNRFFPFYNARCVPALVRGADVLRDTRYTEAAERIVRFLAGTMHQDGSWPQIVYRSGARAEWPRWIAGTADIILAIHAVGAPVPSAALERLLAGRLAPGGFATAQGFASQIVQWTPSGYPDARDVTPVVGWNDKVFRLFCRLLPPGAAIPSPDVGNAEIRVLVGPRTATYRETDEHMTITGDDGTTFFGWTKTEPWSQVSGPLAYR
jgi:hypothetical protein